MTRLRAAVSYRIVLGCALALAVGAEGGAVTFTVNSTADGPDATPGNGVCAAAGGSCTLRAAVMEANALAGADKVQLAALSYQLTLIGAGDGAGDLDLTSDVEIAGAGATITAVVGIDRVIEVSAGNGNVHDLTLHALGSTGNPTCLWATSPVVATNVACDLGVGGKSFETGDLSEWSANSP
jgi:CSLREA domain-containing protein